MRYTQEQMDKLQPLETILRQAYYHDYKRSTTYLNNKMVDEIYREVTGSKDKRNLNCGVCVLQLYRQAGKIYFETLASMAKEKEAEIVDVEPEPKDVSESVSASKKNKRVKKVAKNGKE